MKVEDGSSQCSWKNAPPLFNVILKHLICMAKQYLRMKLSQKRFFEFEAHSWMDSCTTKVSYELCGESWNLHASVIEATFCGHGREGEACYFDVPRSGC